MKRRLLFVLLLIAITAGGQLRRRSRKSRLS